MAHVNRRIGKSSETAGPTADGTGGGVLDAFIHDYFNRSGNVPASPGQSISGLTATGGVINDFAISGTVYRAHIFTSTGPFNVIALSTDPGLDDNIDYLVVAGGGGGGEDGTTRGGGGGAGGLRSNFPTIPAGMKTPSFTASVQDYAITVGAGGVGAMISGAGYINPGSNSSIGSAVVASGGGGGGNRLNDPAPGNYPNSPEMAGGSGGGGGSGPGSGTGGPTVNSPDPLTPQAQGNAGGNGDGGGPNYGAGGGGGAGAAGQSGTSSAGGNGGNGLQVLIAGPPASVQPVGTPGTNPGGGYFAGGGGGGVYTESGRGTGGDGGGGDGGNNPGLTSSTAGTQSTGGGGGGNHGKSGGSGIVVIRYKIGSIVGTAKATGGAISFYGGKTIHTFTGNGTFTTTSDWNAGTNEVEYVCVGGGGGGGGADQNCWGAGGGGAGQMRFGTTTISHPSPVAITIGAGGFGGTRYDDYTATSGSNTTVAFPAGTITGYGGGYGSSNSPSTQTQGADGTNYPNVPAGSGSGGGGSKNGNGGDGGPSALGAYPGGDMPGTNNGYVGAGGGGAGAAGQIGSPDAPQSGPQIASYGAGGIGLQVPTTFRNPAVTFDGVHSDSQHYLAGGGGGGLFNPNPQVNPDRGGKGGGGAGGGGAPGIPGSRGGNGLSNTGGGGGGSGSFNDTTLFMGGNGGSGIVLIAYPT